MTDTEKLARLVILLSASDSDEVPSNELLLEYLHISEAEILNRLYERIGEVPDDAQLPKSYEQVQIMAVIAAVNIVGAEGQSLFIENGTHRQFKYDDLIAYIRAHVPPYVVI